MLIYRGDYRFDLRGVYPVKLPILVNDPQVIIEIICDRKPNTWNVAGTIEQTGLVESVGFCTLKSFSIGFNKKAYDLINSQSQLIFKPVIWLRLNTSIRIYKMPLSLSGTTAIALVPSTTAANIPLIVAAVASTLLLPANPARICFSVTNTTSKILFLDYDGTASTTDYAVAIPAGGYFEPPVNFTGAVHGVWSATDGTKGALVREFV